MKQTATRHFVAAAFSALALVAAPALAQDASVKGRLDERGLKYEVDADGDFRVVYHYKTEGRTQMVFVSGKTHSVGGYQVREVFSPAGRVERDGIDGTRALKLLAGSRDMKLGSWEIGGGALYFVIKLPDSLSAEQLEKAMDIAAETADNMELELSGKRDEL